MDERKRKSGIEPGGEIQKGSTCGTAVGAKQGRAKGNKQKAKHSESDRMHGKPGRKKEEEQESESGTEKLKKANCEAETAEKRK